MATIRIYETDAYRKEHRSTVRSVLLTEEECKAKGIAYKKNTAIIELDETIFYPEGGGQPADGGTIEGLVVVHVFNGRQEDTVFHRVHIEEGSRIPAQGDEVRCILDWDRRLAHMQLHTAEHLLSGLAHALWGGVNKGFHMSQDYATFDILLPRGGAEEWTGDMTRQLEEAANRAVWENVPVVTHRCATEAEAESHPLRKPLTVEEGITVVTVGEGESPYDCCACCGTHVSTTGGIGLIQLLRTDNYKGMTRITCTAGLPAYLNAVLRQRITDVLCVRHSTEVDHLLERIDAQDQKNGAVRKELYDLKKDLLREEAELLEPAWEEAAAASIPDGAPALFVQRYDRYSADDLQTLGQSLGATIPMAGALVSEREHTVLLMSSGSPHAGDLVRDYANIYGGRGGGKSTLARALFSTAEDVDLFLDLIEKHLKSLAL